MNYKVIPTLTFTQAVQQALSNIFSFKGRSRRSEFWWFTLTFCVFNVALSFIYKPLVSLAAASIISICINALMIPISVRRLHDRNHCGILPILVWLIDAANNLYLIFKGYVEQLSSVNGAEKASAQLITDPVVMGLSACSVILGVIMLVLFCKDGKKEPNRYGPSPKYVIDDAEL